MARISNMQPYNIDRDEINDFLLNIGVRPGLLGFVYLGDLIDMFCRNPDSMYCGLYNAYKTIGGIRGKGGTGVEHACSTAISTCSNHRFSGMLVSDFIAYAVIVLPKHYDTKPL